MIWRVLHLPSNRIVAHGDGTDTMDCIEAARDAALEAIREQPIAASFRLVVENDHGERVVDAPLVLWSGR